MSTAQTTPNLGLTQPTLGAQNWGPVINQNFMAIDTAVGNLQSGFQGAWSSTQIYTKGQTVSFAGGGASGTYISLLNANQGQSPDVAPTYWAVQAINGTTFAFEGAYSAGTTYLKGQTVSYRGSSYGSLVDGNTGNTPPSSQWMLLAQAGAPGQLSSASLTSSLATLLYGVNLVDPSKVIPGVWTGQGSFVGGTGFSSDYLPANAGGNMITRKALYGASAVIMHYDANKAFLRTTTSVIPEGGTIPCDFDEGFVIVPWGGDGVGAVYWGDTLPAVDAPYGPLTIAATLGSSAFAPAVLSAVTTNPTVANQVALGAIASLYATLPHNVNLYDPVATIAGIINNNGAVVQDFQRVVSALIPLLPGKIYTVGIGEDEAAGGYGWCTYDALGNKVRTLASLPIPNGFEFTAQAGEYGLRIFNNGAVPAQTVTIGAGVPATFVPFASTPTKALITSLVSHEDFANTKGLKLAVMGDSITDLYRGNWLPTVLSRLGMTVVYIDAHAGRGLDASHFWDSYGGSPTGVNIGPSWTNTGTAGNTFAQDLAASAPDILIVLIGTNGIAIGSPGSGPGTEYGEMKTIMAALITARPVMRVLWFTQYLNGFGSFDGTPASLTSQSIAAAQYTGKLYGIPVCNLAESLGINAITEGWDGTTATTPFYTLDGIHPSALGGSTRLGPRVANFIEEQA